VFHTLAKFSLFCKEVSTDGKWSKVPERIAYLYQPQPK